MPAPEDWEKLLTHKIKMELIEKGLMEVVTHPVTGEEAYRLTAAGKKVLSRLMNKGAS